MARLDAGKVDMDGIDDNGVTRELKGNWDSLDASARIFYRAIDDNKLNVFAGISQGFRAPNLADTTRSGEFGAGLEAPTADLDAEHFLTWEIGTKTRTDTFTLDLTLFYTEIKDRIGKVENGVENPTKVNLDNGYVQGVEVNFSKELNNSLSLFGYLAWQEGSEDFYELNAGGKPDVSLGEDEYPLSRIMPLTGEIGLHYKNKNKKFWTEFFVEFADSQDRLGANDRGNRFLNGTGTPGYTTFNIRGGLQVWKNINLTISLENITDKNYGIHGSGVNAPGRNLVFSLVQKI